MYRNALRQKTAFHFLCGLHFESKVDPQYCLIIEFWSGSHTSILADQNWTKASTVRLSKLT
jgi:hypothetical protein